MLLELGDLLYGSCVQMKVVFKIVFKGRLKPL